MDQDFISLHVKNTRRSDRSDQNDVYQDYIDNIDEEYKDINQFAALSIDDPQPFDDVSSETDSLDEIHAEIYNGSGISKSQVKKAKKEAKRLRKEIQIQDSLDRHDDAMELVKVLNKSKGFLDKSVVDYLKKENKKILEFMQSNQDTMVLGTMPAAIRDFVQEIADKYHVITKTRGRAKNKVFVLIKNSASRIPENSSKIVDEITRGKMGLKLSVHKFWYGSPKTRKNKISGAPNSETTPQVGDVVGGKAPALTADSSIGHAMLLKMGWKPGDSLGDGNGIVEPIQAVIRSKRGGLGTE